MGELSTIPAIQITITDFTAYDKLSFVMLRGLYTTRNLSMVIAMIVNTEALATTTSRNGTVLPEIKKERDVKMEPIFIFDVNH